MYFYTDFYNRSLWNNFSTRTNFILEGTCYYDSSLMDDKDGSVYPILPWVGGMSTDMTPYKCFLGCLKIDMVEKETDLTIGLSPMPGDDGKIICFCGHAFDTSSKLKY